MEYCFDRHVELYGLPKNKLQQVSAPSLGEKSVSNADLEAPGELSSIAAKVPLNGLNAARTCREDMLYSVASLFLVCGMARLCVPSFGFSSAGE